MIDVHAALRVAHDLADLADALTLPAFHGELTVEIKGDGTPVTAVDRDVERTLRTRLRGRFPDHAVLGEEDGLDGPEGAPRWILDPIDGTKNFVAGVPVFGTLIALQVEGEEVVGLVSAPALGSRWWGVRGGPAHHNEREVHVSTTTTLAQATVSLGGLNYFVRKGYGPSIDRLASGTARQRGFGDFWQHCLVATGAIDAALEAEVSLWDLAAVKCIVEAAGGRFTDLDGTRTADGGSALATNGLVHDAALDLVRR